MAIGDAAAAKGLAVYSSAQQSSNGFENNNQRGDEIAPTMTRLDTVEAAFNQPIVAVRRSTAGTTIDSHTWRPAASSFATRPDMADGVEWTGSAGELRILKAGVYRLQAFVTFTTPEPDSAGIQVTRNSTEPNTGATILGSINTGRGCLVAGYQCLALGDVLRMFIIQRNSAGDRRSISTSSNDLTMSAEWVRD